MGTELAITANLAIERPRNQIPTFYEHDFNVPKYGHLMVPRAIEVSLMNTGGTADRVSKVMDGLNQSAMSYLLKAARVR